MIAVSRALRCALKRRPKAKKGLLACGVVSSAWWVAVDVIASRRYPGYSYLDQTISELSAEGAPTRAFLMTVNAVPYGALVVAFGFGVRETAGRTRAGRATGTLLIASGLIGLAGGILFPMMVRGAKGDLRNAMHAPYGAVSILLFLLIMMYGARLFGPRFRLYTYATIVVLLVFGALMGVQSGRMVANEPTPWMGLEERISVYATMLWIAVLAIGLLQSGATAQRQSGRPTVTARASANAHEKSPV